MIEARSKPFRSPDTPKSKAELVSERFARWHRAPSGMGRCSEPFCIPDLFHVRRASDGKWYCKQHFP